MDKHIAEYVIGVTSRIESHTDSVSRLVATVRADLERIAFHSQTVDALRAQLLVIAQREAGIEPTPQAIGKARSTGQVARDLFDAFTAERAETKEIE